MNPTFFLMRLSVVSVVFVSRAYKVKDSGAARFWARILPAGVEIVVQTAPPHDLAVPSGNPEIPLPEDNGKPADGAKTVKKWRRNPKEAEE